MAVSIFVILYSSFFKKDFSALTHYCLYLLAFLH
uniref:Uncharacterized protein n=1 Tax=Anguilla anguilla TaxID=7936 RepID=A0A0E9V2R1_ANGAN